MNDNPGCAACGLDAGCVTPYMLPGESLDGPCDVMFVGEAPGANEDQQGIPFVGRSGQLLRDAVESVGLDVYNLVYTNVLHCRPPENKTPTKKQIKLCLPILKDELERYQPRLIILLGSVPLNAVLGETGITNWRGTLVERHSIAYLPMFHPAYILRDKSALEGWVSDFEKALGFLGGDGIKDVTEGYEVTLVTTIEQALDMRDAISRAGECSWDTEAAGLRYGDELIMMSFAVNRYEKRAWAVGIPEPLDVVHKGDLWRPSAMHDTNMALRARCWDILFDGAVGKIGHNIKFDALVIHGNHGREVKGITGDSMLASYAIDPVPGRHGLKPLAGRHLGMYGYDEEFGRYKAAHKDTDPKYGGDLREVPMEILGNYSALDAIATLELHQFLVAQMDEEQCIVYEQLLMPASETFTHLQTSGCVLDDYIVDRYIKIYSIVREEQLDQLLNDNLVQSYVKFRFSQGIKKFEFNPRSSYQMRDILYGCVFCPECHKVVTNQNVKSGRRYECEKCDLEFKAAKGQVFKGLRLKPTMFTDTGRPSTKWDVIKAYENDNPILSVYRYYRLLSKMLSTYLEPARDTWKDGDGRVRSNYLLHGTDTGRASSREPNLQNIPTPEKEPGTLLENLPIKNVFTHSWSDGCLMCVDFSGMELRTMASISQCQEMINIFQRGEDLHSIVTEFLYGVKRADYMPGQWKSMRYRAKWVNWTLLFGGSEYTLYRLYGIEKVEASRLVKRYYDLFPEVLDYREDVLAFARENGYVRSKFGRRKYLPYINDWNDGKRKADERAGINMPIQSSAFDVLLCAMIIIAEQMREEDYVSKLVNTVHDSLMLDTHPDEVDDVAWLCKEVMENVTTKYGPERFPKLDFSWFTVPLVVDIEIGSHYGTLDHYGGK